MSYRQDCVRTGLFLLIVDVCFAWSSTTLALPNLKMLAPKSIHNTADCQKPPQHFIQNSSGLKVDRLLVLKSTRELFLLNQGQIIKKYHVSMGFGFALGPKLQDGDGRTPEGVYRIVARQTQSHYHLALRLSYPEPSDIEYAAENGLRPGSDIMIHGLPDAPVDQLDPEQIKKIHGKQNWTRGCIAVTNTEIEEIFSRVEVGTFIEICPL